jgi:cytochrome P450
MMEYNPFLPEVRENPYPYYAHLRENAPVYQVPGIGFWAVSRYDDVHSVLRAPQVFSSAVLANILVGDLNPFPPESPVMISSDPPYHTRLRKLVNRAFTPRRIASMEARVREISQQLIASMAAQGKTCELVRDLAIPLPIMAIAELLGVPPEQYQDFKRWANNLIKAFNGAAMSPEEREGVRATIAEWQAYFDGEIAACRSNPGDNLLSDLVRAEDENQVLSGEEVMSLAMLVLAGGAETTTNLIGSAMLALLEHPEQLAQVRANPKLVANVVEETLRYDGVVQAWPRQTTQEVEIAGTNVPSGSVVLFLLGSANHDERKFADPERFDIHRNTDGHMGFGFGIHFCLGAQLARLETKVALEGMLAQFPHIARTEEPHTRPENPFFRGLKTLPLAVQ